MRLLAVCLLLFAASASLAIHAQQRLSADPASEARPDLKNRCEDEASTRVPGIPGRVQARCGSSVRFGLPDVLPSRRTEALDPTREARIVERIRAGVRR